MTPSMLDDADYMERLHMHGARVELFGVLQGPMAPIGLREKLVIIATPLRHTLVCRRSG